jgi:hypothetical protein
MKLLVCACQRRNLMPIATLACIGLFTLTIGISIAYTFVDEVAYAEPAINLLRGEGYRSAAYNVTTASQTHVSTAPAHSVLLYVWLKLFGISQCSVRSLAAVLALIGAAVLWRACVRLGWLAGGFSSSLLIALVLLDYGCAFSYSCGRPDSLSFLVLATVFYLASFPSRRVTLWFMGAIGLLLPFVQWATVIFTFALCGGLFFVFGKRILKPALVLSLGMILGLAAQYFLYSHLGLWDTWMLNIKGEGSASILQRIIDRLTSNPLSHHSNVISKDITSWILLAGLGIEFARSKLSGERLGIWLGKAAAIIALAVGVGMYLVGKFPTYYGWMLCAPLAVIICVYCEKVAARRRAVFASVVSIGILACAVGLPFQFFVALYDWKDRQPAMIDAWLESKIGKDDVVYCDFPFYYPAKLRAKRVYAGNYILPMTPAEAQQVTLAIIGTKFTSYDGTKLDLSKAREKGRWVAGRSSLFGNAFQYGFLSAPNYECILYDLKNPR